MFVTLLKFKIWRQPSDLLSIIWENRRLNEIDTRDNC